VCCACRACHVCFSVFFPRRRSTWVFCSGAIFQGRDCSKERPPTRTPGSVGDSCGVTLRVIRPHSLCLSMPCFCLHVPYLFCLCVLHSFLLSQRDRHAHVHTHNDTYTQTHKDTNPKTRPTYHVAHPKTHTHTHTTVSYKRTRTDTHTNTHTHTHIITRYVGVCDDGLKSCVRALYPQVSEILSPTLFVSSTRATRVTFASGAISDKTKFEKIRHLPFKKKPGTSKTWHSPLFTVRMTLVQSRGRAAVPKPLRLPRAPLPGRQQHARTFQDHAESTSCNLNSGGDGQRGTRTDLKHMKDRQARARVRGVSDTTCRCQ